MSKVVLMSRKHVQSDYPVVDLTPRQLVDRIISDKVQVESVRFGDKNPDLHLFCPTVTRTLRTRITKNLFCFENFIHMTPGEPPVVTTVGV